MDSNLEAYDEDTDAQALARLKPPGRPWLWAAAVASAAGGTFAGVSTHDFIKHLDRQAHSIHCSIVPGGGASLGESGCRTVLMSPYSSLFRTELWGGLPISLLAFAVFAYLVYRSVSTALQPRLLKSHTGYLWLATGLPMSMSIIYGLISAQTIGALCEVCLGIYITSLLAFTFAAIAHRNAEPTVGHQSPWPNWGRWFAEGVASVGLLAALYVGFSPEDPQDKKSCGVLVQTKDPNHILVKSKHTRGTAALMVLDPLCPACKGFDARLETSGLGDKLDMNYLLFPLDASCNWMLETSLHPGACAVSEAMLCEPAKAEEVLAWAFRNQAKLLEMAKTSEKKVRQQLLTKFPGLKGCLGSNRVKSKLRKSLRWGVANAIPVLTPQLFVADKRICDEDTDLGLEFTLTAMLKAEGGLQ